ncbi:hypothetical protein Tcan_13551 [Toxocara canis]|nr:hypothetical protein Tcan_13551 [Toxocara canis]
MENVSPIVLGIAVSAICFIALIVLIAVFYFLIKRSSRRRVLSLTMHRKERGFVDGVYAPHQVCISAFEKGMDPPFVKKPSVTEPEVVMSRSPPPPRILLTTPSLKDKEISLNDIPIA